MELTKVIIDSALPLIENGLIKYLFIQNNFHKTNVFEDREFQKKFNHFYRVRRGSEWQEKFYRILEESKNCDRSFSEVLEALSHSTGRVEASFSSKLLATVKPNNVVLDSIVLKNMGLKLPYSSVKNRKEKVVDIFNNLDRKLNEIVISDAGEYLVSEFKKMYPEANITKIKMLDLVLWQTR